MRNILVFFKKLRAYINSHKLYASMHVLVGSLIIAVILMQSSSLFLFDYIPNHLSTISQAYNEQMLWKQEMYKLQNNAGNQGGGNSGISLTISNFDYATYAWSKKQSDTQLAAAYAKLSGLHRDFIKCCLYEASKEQTLQKGKLIIDAYDEFIAASKADVEAKQSVVQVLQLACVFLAICIGACIMLTAWRILITRLGNIFELIPQDLINEDKDFHYGDELEKLEKLTAEMSARIQGYQAENSWTNKVSMEKSRKTLLSQDFLFKLAKLIASSDLNEATIKKVLYSMEKTLNLKNVALMFSESGSSFSAQRALFSNYMPLSFDMSIFDQELHMFEVKNETKLIQGACVQYTTVPLPSPSGWLGILLIETEANHYFEDMEIQLIEVTSQLLSMAMGFQAREQEGRRVALLEERAVIARELHDSLAQSLSYMKFQLARLQSIFSTELVKSGAAEIANDIREGLDNAYKELRELLTTFRVQMDVRGLDHVLEETISEFSSRSTLSITLDNRLQECRLTVNEEFHLLHVIREALSNIVRHSGANKVKISLVLQSTGDVIVMVDDDGIGPTFDDSKPHHYGLAIMTERAHCLGGDIQITPRRLGGTRVRLVFRPKNEGIKQ
ncbi:MAG: histidine kinase [Methylophilus sp.]|uniref:histidine kinase n=1 Tax=Methylophilus sp. TaxID=29541 RepID=UPI003F9F2DAF